MRTSSIFSERRIYPSDLVKAKGYNLESPFAKLFHEKLMSGKCGEKIILSRKEIILMKRFSIGDNPCLFNAWNYITRKNYFRNIFSSVSYFQRKKLSSETASDSWHRNIKVAVESEDLSHISEHPLCTLELLKWDYIFRSGYFAIWDCTESGVDFLISDIGMT